MWAKQSTAATLIVGPILDSTGAEYTSAVIGDLSISKNGGTLTALASAATLTHIANGQYGLLLTTGNLNTLGRLQITCNKSTYQMPEVRLMVVPAMVFDSMILGSDRFDVNVTHVTDTTQTAGDLYASQVAIAGYIDTEVGAIKAKTDQLTFTTANKVDSTAVLDPASRLAIWNTLTTESFAADSFGDLLIISDGTNGREVKVTGAKHIAADVHECQADGLTASTEITAVNTFATRVTTGLVADGPLWQFTANMLKLGPANAGGGDATLAKQNEILAAIQGTEVIQVASPNVNGNLVLTQGDDYDGTANPRAQWTVTTDYTDGWSVTLTIRDADDAVVYTTSGTVVSSTVIAVTIAAPTGLTMTGCPGQWQGKFDVQLTKAGKKKTIALGVCYINEDQTR